MRLRLLPTLALAAALGSTIVIALQAEAQQGFGSRMWNRDRAQTGTAARLSPTDRAAFLDAHLAAIRAGLKLTPEQEALWPAVETAVRDGAKKLADLGAQTRAQPRPADPIEGMRRMADAATARGDALHKIVDAAQPLYASLSDDQKRRLPMLMRGMRGPGGMMRGRFNGQPNAGTGNPGPAPVPGAPNGLFGGDRL